MTTRNYNNLALAWVPDNQETRGFYIITAIVMFVLLVLAVVVTSVDVPPKERRARGNVPERVAQFITQQEKPEPPEPVATPTPKPIPTPKPKVVRRTETEAEKKKPLTEKQKEDRKTAEKSGLLAHVSELADLIDTSEVSSQVGSKVKKTSQNAREATTVNSDVLTANAAGGSGGVKTTDYVAGGVSSTKLSQREVAALTQTLVEGEDGTDDADDAKRERTGAVRSEEEVAVVFDAHKGKLFSIYNRERRKKPGLKGKLVLEITIEPDGSVSKVKIASSELNDASLERRLVARIKTFKFAAKAVERVTVTFPIEFLPS